MMHRLPLVALLLAGSVTAQAEQSPPTKPPPDDLEREFNEARTKHNEALRAASQAKDQDAVKKLIAENPALTFGPRFAAKAKEHAGTPAAVPYLVWVVGNAHADLGSAALSTLLDEHVDDPRIAPAVARLGVFGNRIDAERARNWAAKVIDKNPAIDVQLQARFTRAGLHVGTRAREHSDTLRQTAIADLEAVIAGSKQTSLVRMAESLLHEAKHLEPGLVAPDIEAEDLDGVKFKLSDYRGKVVLLDFWGDW